MMMTMKHLNSGSLYDYRACKTQEQCPSYQPHCCAGRCVCDISCNHESSEDCLDHGACDDPADFPGICAGRPTANTIVSLWGGTQELHWTSPWHEKSNRIEITRLNRIQDALNWNINVWNSANGCPADFPYTSPYWTDWCFNSGCLNFDPSLEHACPMEMDNPCDSWCSLDSAAVGCGILCQVPEPVCSATFPMPEDEWKTIVVRYQANLQSLSIHKIPADIPYVGDGPIPDSLYLTFVKTGCCDPKL